MAEGIGLLNQRIEFLYHGFESHFLRGDVVQLAERMLCKHEVTGSSPIISKVLFLKKIHFYDLPTYAFFEIF